MTNHAELAHHRQEHTIQDHSKQRHATHTSSTWLAETLQCDTLWRKGVHPARATSSAAIGSSSSFSMRRNSHPHMPPSPFCDACKTAADRGYAFANTSRPTPCTDTTTIVRARGDVLISPGLCWLDFLPDLTFASSSREGDKGRHTTARRVLHATLA